MKKCPYCAEEIQNEAVLCRFCKSDLRSEEELQEEQAVKAKSGVMDGVKIGFGMFIVLPLIILGVFIAFVLLASTFGVAVDNKYIFITIAGIFVVYLVLKQRKREQMQSKEIPVSIVKGFWICPSCKEKNRAVNDACSVCSQPVSKTHP